MRVLIGILFLCMSVAMAATPAVYTEDKLAVMVQASQPEFSIKLVSNPTTGFSWYLRAYDGKVLQPVKHVFQAPENKKLIGAPGYEIWTFRVKPSAFLVPMQTAIRFVYARPWEMNSQVKQVVFQVTT